MLCQWTSLPMTALPGSQPIHRRSDAERKPLRFGAKTTCKRCQTKQLKSSVIVHSFANDTATYYHSQGRQWQGTQWQSQLQQTGSYSTTARLLEANKLLTAADHILARRSDSKPIPLTRNASTCITVQRLVARLRKKKVADASQEHFVVALHRNGQHRQGLAFWKRYSA